MDLHKYIASLDERRKLGNATEHTYRGDLSQLLEAIDPSIKATNEPKRRECGAPDYILTKKGIPVGFIEAKDLGDKDLEGKKKTGNKEQFDRYRSSLDNILFTDYVNFLLYRNGELVTRIAIGKLQGGGVVPLPENFDRFENLITDFCSHVGQNIKSPKRLAQMMAGKARLLSDIIEKSLLSDEVSEENSTLKEQMLAFQQVLIHDITPNNFADVYAQTIAYGMFAARLHDPTLDSFSRQEAAELIPKSNPFLRKLFGYIAGPDIDDRIKWVVENLAAIFLACNVAEILRGYGKATRTEDPIIHFYETFLSEYDPGLKKSRGVWYTPQPVVNFIVRSVNDILKSEFDLQQGLADTQKTTISVNTQARDRRSSTGYKKVQKEVHRVQILDPATGTGTFLTEVVKHIHRNFHGQQGLWSKYVQEHLLPRLNGFELLMASYAMAHLKMDLLLTETGFQPTSNQRLKVYLTNSLEEFHQDTGTLFANWLSTEANEANHIKRDAPVMCIIGNPPYSGISSNNGDWISDLIEDYKYVDGVHFDEKKHWLSDDYVKFLRYGQYCIEKNGSGVLAYINPHGFLDNPTFRGMRWHMLKSFDKIYTIDLHGNSLKKETAPGGGADDNVFDIQQGVSINIFVKTGKKKSQNLGEVFHCDLYGKRQVKYDFLLQSQLSKIPFKKVDYSAPFYFFVPKDDAGKSEYEKGFKISEVFQHFTSGMVTANDKLSVFPTIGELNDTTQRILNSADPFTEFNIKDARKCTKEGRLEDLRSAKTRGVMKVHFRPFDVNYMYQFHKNEHWINSPRRDVMQHFVQGENIGLVVGRQGHVVGAMPWNLAFITEDAIDFNIFRRGGGTIYPLYLYPQPNHQQVSNGAPKRTPNLNPALVEQIAKNIGLPFTNEKAKTKRTFSPIDLLDYIYAVLNAPKYREKFKEFLKVDFPRIPYPKDKVTFWRLVKLGQELRQVHLMKGPRVEQFATQYPVAGDNVVTKKITKTSPGYLSTNNKLGRVYINDEQYFDKVPLLAWEFYIGGYQPAQKWLKDRSGCELSFDELFHYQKIIATLSESHKLMKKIDRALSL